MGSPIPILLLFNLTYGLRIKLQNMRLSKTLLFYYFWYDTITVVQIQAYNFISFPIKFVLTKNM